MSTKITIAHGRNFHLYYEAFDEDHVYLELEETKFEASYNRVMLPIPVHVWEVIRRYPSIDLKYAEQYRSRPALELKGCNSECAHLISRFPPEIKRLVRSIDALLSTQLFSNTRLTRNSPFR